MVWEQQVHVVVMTTKCVELGRHKCCQYWPDEGVVQYGNVTVTVTKLQQCEGYELRIMNITCVVRPATTCRYMTVALLEINLCNNQNFNLVFPEKNVLPQVGFEPTTCGYRDKCPVLLDTVHA